MPTGLLRHSASIWKGLTSSPFPTVLLDGNTVAWYDYKEGITIETGVSVWADKSVDENGDLNGNNLLQADTVKQPIWNVNGVYFDGIDDFMKTVPFTLGQPTYIYILFNLKVWVGASRVFDGDNRSLYMLSGVSEPALLIIGAGVPNLTSPELDVPINSYNVSRAFFNGTHSFYKVDDNSTAECDLGTATMDGFTLGAASNGASGHNIEVKEVIIRKVADNITDETAIYNYLKKKVI